MKKRKTLAALILALSFLLPTFACQTADGAESSTPPTSSENSAENDSSNSMENEALPPTQTPPVSTPTTPETPSTPETPTAPAKAQYIRCMGENVNIRSGAGTDYAVLGSAEKGTMYAVIGKTGNWYKTYYKNKTAYIYAEYASVFTLEKTENEKVEQVVAQGYKLLGIPYVYGAVRLHDGKGNFLKGFTAQKFDCSSLVQYVFYQGAGKLLDVTTRTQVKQGKYVAKADLKRGDCIFFTNEERQHKTGVERVGHVAIYLGNNYILHTASDYARIEKMSTKRWSFYIEARRFL